jgi:hypothetical protein
MTMTNEQEPLDHGAEVEVDYDSIEIDFELPKVPAVREANPRFCVAPSRCSRTS